MPTAATSVLPNKPLADEELSHSLTWLINLRWLAGAGILLATWFTTRVLAIKVPANPLYLLGIGVLGYNAFLWWWWEYVKRWNRGLTGSETSSPPDGPANGLRTSGHRSRQAITVPEWFVRFQIGLDWLALTLLLYFSGGIESPTLHFFLFHIFIASLLLPHSRAFLFVTLAPVLVGGLALLEYQGLIPHIHAFEPVRYDSPLYVTGVLLFFTAACYIVAYLSKAIARRLRLREHQLSGLYRQLENRSVTREELLGKVLTAQEEERTRLARELHDIIGQSLTATIMTTASVERSFPAGFAQSKRKLATARNIAAQALQDLRAVISDLRPETLDDLGLVMALRVQAKEHLESAGIKVELQATGLKERLPADVEIVIFRVVQEAITNIVRHAQAGEVRISLTKTASQLTVLVADDGQGFEPEQVMRGQRQAWGLRGMEERVMMLDGQLSVTSTPGDGTTVLVEVPL